jgi:polysaccharide export outer membrane protein
VSSAKDILPALSRSPSPANSQPISRIYEHYILGPGDSLVVELLDIPQYSGTFSIGPDGTIYLPQLRGLYVEGLTLEELRYFLTQQFKAYVKNPQVYLRPVGYRPIRIYVGGEVRLPGYYTLSGVQVPYVQQQPDLDQDLSPGSNTNGLGARQSASRRFINQQGLSGGSSSSTLFPTVFDAIRTAEGITPYSDLAQVQVTRKQPLSAGGGRIRTNLNFLTLITEGNESQNIRLFDGDVVHVGKSPVVMREQLLKAGQTNLSPQFIQVFVNGRVVAPGGVTLPQGSSLNQALSLAGGTKLLKGKVEFVRFTREGEVDRRLFSYNPNAASASYTNPILMTGDIVRVRDSALSASAGVLGEVTAPLLGIYSIYALSNGAFR